METFWSTCESPLGTLTLVAGGGRLRGIRFPGEGRDLAADRRRPEDLADAARQLDQYFAGERRGFDLAVELAGSPLQRAVWAQLREIPFGETVFYRKRALLDLEARQLSLL